MAPSVSDLSLNVMNTTTAVLTDSGKGLMTIAQFLQAIKIFLVIYVCLNTSGLLSNIINMKTFIKMGFTKDGVTFAFLLLALSDIGLNCSSLLLCMFTFFYNFESALLSVTKDTSRAAGYKPTFLVAVDPTGGAVFSFNIVTIFNITTAGITVYLAVARCLCVVRPLQFRDIISVRKTSVVVAGFFGFSLASRLPLMTYMRMPMTLHPVVNRSRPTLWIHPHREMIRNVMWTAVDMPVSIGTQVTLFVCVIIMIRGLEAANKFRSIASATAKTSPTMSKLKNNQTEHLAKTSTTNSTTLKNGDSKKDPPTNNKDEAQKLSTKDARVVKQLVLICTIFIICNVPKVVRNVSTLIEPDFNMGERYETLYFTTGHIVNLLDSINSSVNLFIYLTYNSKFRSMCTLC